MVSTIRVGQVRWVIGLLLLLGGTEATGKPSAGELDSIAAPGAAVGEEPPAPPTDEMALFQDIPSIQTASKYEQRSTEAPSAVTVITAADIRHNGYRTLAEVLRRAASFYLTYDRNYVQVGVRGFGRPGDFNSRVLVLINGHRINDDVYDGAALATDGFIEVSAIERVEIVRGPSSSLYGTSAFFAVINVITKRGRDLKTLELAGSWASYDTYRGAASYGTRFANGVELFATASAIDSRGQNLYYPEFSDVNGGFAQGRDHDRAYRFFSVLSWRDLTAQGGIVWRRKGIPTASYDTVFDDPRNMTWDQRAFAELRYERTFRTLWDFTARAYFDQMHYRGEYAFANATEQDPTGTVLNLDAAESKTWGAEVRVTARPLRWLTVVGGTELRHMFEQDQWNADADQVYLDDRRSSVNYAAFLQATVAPWRQAMLNCGVRYDYYETFGSTVNPRCALIINPHRTTTIKLLYGDAFRAPSALERYYHDSGLTQKPSVGLEPEKIRSGEVVVEQRIVEGLQLSGSLFYNHISNLIDLQVDAGDGLMQYRNAESARAVGVEITLDARWWRGWEASASYSFQDVQNTGTGRWLSNSPKHLAKGNLLIPIVRDRLLAGLELQYTSARRTLAGNETGHYLRANLTLSAPNLLRGLSAYASVYNFFDKRYYHPGSAEHRQDAIEQNGRNFWLELTYAF